MSYGFTVHFKDGHAEVVTSGGSPDLNLTIAVSGHDQLNYHSVSVGVTENAEVASDGTE
jgi:hypothetical protein